MHSAPRRAPASPMLSRGSHGKGLVPAGPVSSFQLRSYKPAASFSRLAPTAGSLKNYLRSPLRHSFWAAPQGPFIQFGTILPNLWQKVKYKFSFVGCGGTVPRASGGCLAGSAAEGTFSALQAGDAPRAYFSCAGKVGKSAPGRPRPPSVCLIGHLQGSTRLPLKYLFAPGFLVIGAVLHELRLSPLGLMGISCCAKKQMNPSL